MGLFSKKNISVLGIELSSSSIKVVQIKREKGQAILETYGELALGPYAGIEAGKSVKLSDDKMAEALRDLMREAQVTTNNCGIAIPLNSSLINVVQMPDLGEKKMMEMIPIEMRKYIPVAISEVMLDWRVIPDIGGRAEAAEDRVAKRIKRVDILVVAIHKETINRFHSIMEKAELAPAFFEIEVFSTVRGVLGGSSPAAMIIDMGASATKMYMVEHRVLRQSHSINRGGQDITLAISKSLGVSAAKAEDLKRTHGLMPNGEQPTVAETASLVVDEMLTEAHRVLLNYQKRYQKTVDVIILTGGGAGLKGLAERANKALEVQVEIADPFEKLVTPAFLEKVLEQVGPEFAVSVGVALRRLEELN